MKDFVFSDTANTFEKEYKTEHIGDQVNLTVHDFRTRTTQDITDDILVRAGLNFRRLEYTVAAFDAFATTSGLKLVEIDYAANTTTTRVAGGSFVISTTSFADGNVGTDYTSETGTIVLATTGGTGASVYELISGNFPNGMSMTRAGVLQGTPTVAGTYTLFFSARDTTAKIAIKRLTLTIN